MYEFKLTRILEKTEVRDEPGWSNLHFIDGKKVDEEEF